MRVLPVDWKEYIRSMPECDVCIVDPPWNYKDTINRPGYTDRLQLDYPKWDTSVDLEHLFKEVKSKYLFIWSTNSLLQEIFQSISENKKWSYKTTITWVK